MEALISDQEAAQLPRASDVCRYRRTGTYDDTQHQEGLACFQASQMVAKSQPAGFVLFKRSQTTTLLYKDSRASIEGLDLLRKPRNEPCA